MKKQIITLAMCLSLTASSALAEGTKTVIKTAKPQVSAQSVSNALGKSTMSPLFKQGQPQKRMTKEEAKKFFEEQRKKEREFMYNKLSLSPEQKLKAEALDEKTKKEVQPLIKKLHEEAKKMKDLKEKKANSLSIWMQKQALKSAKNDVKKRIEASKKDFEALLTPAQKTKFNELEEARKKEMEKFKKRQNPQKSKRHGAPPKMGEHGPRFDGEEGPGEPFGGPNPMHGPHNNGDTPPPPPPAE